MFCHYKYLLCFLLFVSQWAVAICQNDHTYDIACLRTHYAKPTTEWHAPTVDDDINWTELAPSHPISPRHLRHLPNLANLYFLKKHFHQMDKLPASVDTTQTMPLPTHARCRLAYLIDKANVTANLCYI